MNLHFRHYYWRWLKNLGLTFLLVLLLLSVFRLGFALYFGNWRNLLEEGRALQTAFLLGMRYDLIPLAYVNLIPFLLLNIAFFIPGKSIIRITRKLIITILGLGYAAIFWLYFMDYAFYSYFQDHINVLFFGFFEDDTFAVLMGVWKNYNLPLWLTILGLLHYAGYRFLKLMVSPYDFDLKARAFNYKIPLNFILGLVFLAFAGRGSFTRLPLSIEDAHFSNNEFVNEIAVTGPIALNRAIKIRKVFGKGEYDYLRKFGFRSWQEAYEAAFFVRPQHSRLIPSLKRRTPVNATLKDSSPHVVMVVMESFGTYWNDQNAPDFNILGDLDQHFKKGLLFENFLPAENGTIGSMVSVAASQVIRPGARFLSESEYMQTKLSSSGHIPYQQQGYETHFVYGGKLGWRDLGKFLKKQGYDRLWGADEIKEAMPELLNFDPKDLGNEWGIFDEYLYTFIEEQLRTATRPQFFLVLTTSNHPPFEFPSTYKPLPLELSPEKLQKITLSQELAKKRFLVVQYANQKMAEFLKRLRSSTVQDKAIVAVTGDHSYWVAKGVGQAEEFRRYAVPFFISAPDDLKPAEVNLKRFGSHEDIFPTLYHLSLSDQEYVSLGENLLSAPGHSVNSSWLYANQHGAYHHGEFWKWKNLDKQLLEKTEATPELQRLKRHAEGLISITDLYLKEEKQRTQTDEENDRR